MEDNETRPAGIKASILVPLAIIIAGAFIAGALVYVKSKNPSAVATAISAQEKAEDTTPPVTADDHILGSPTAPVTIIEYSDTDCPYCQQFQPTLHKIISEFGPTGQVSWVYRHFAFHPNAPKEAEATECVAELGGNEKFWQFVDLLFSKKDFTQTPYKGLDIGQLPGLASSIGVDATAFQKCLDSGKYTSKITSEYNDAVTAGAEGTPYTIIVTRTGKIPITSGAISYASLRSAIVALLKP